MHDLADLLVLRNFLDGEGTFARKDSKDPELPGGSELRDAYYYVATRSHRGMSVAPLRAQTTLLSFSFRDWCGFGIHLGLGGFALSVTLAHDYPRGNARTPQLLITSQPVQVSYYQARKNRPEPFFSPSLRRHRTSAGESPIIIVVLDADAKRTLFAISSSQSLHRSCGSASPDPAQYLSLLDHVDTPLDVVMACTHTPSQDAVSHMQRTRT